MTSEQDTSTCVVCGGPLARRLQLGELIAHWQCSQYVRRESVNAYEAGRRAERDAVIDANRQAQAAADAWNDAHPVGSAVRYWTGLREGRARASATRSAASVLGGHTAVVWVVGESACIALTHVERANDPVPAYDQRDGAA